MAKKYGRWQHWRNTVINLGTIFILLIAISYLPADTSLSQIKERGVLKLCVPASYPPFVTGDPEQPGYDIELVQAIAQKIGVRVTVNVLPSIGRDFNPRNWMVTRGQCDILGGGIADTVRTRNFMQTIPTDIKLGWMLLSPEGARPEQGDKLIVIPGNSGLNRLELSGWLRNQGLQVTALSMQAGEEHVVDQVFAALRDGSAKGLVAENFTACSLLHKLNALNKQGEAKNVTASWLLAPENKPTLEYEKISGNKTNNAENESYSLALSLWKGDTTLKRAVENALWELGKSGKTAALRNFYMGDSSFCEF